jgi:hypothetical protein
VGPVGCGGRTVDVAGYATVGMKGTWDGTLKNEEHLECGV